MLLVSIATLVAVWPASILKLSVVKNLGVNAYYSRALVLSPRFHDVYVTLLERYPVMSGLAVATAAALASRQVRLPAGLVPFAVYAAAMVILQLGNQNLKPLYYVSLQPVLAVLSASCLVAVLDRRDARGRWLAVVIVALTLAVGATAWRASLQPRVQSPFERFVHALEAHAGIVGERVLTLPPGSHVAQALGFYVPDTRFVRVVDEASNRRRAAAAVRRGAFRFVIVGGSLERVRENFGVLDTYERVTQITDTAGQTRFQLLRRPYD